ncbi:hypothetical protein J4Q44_G00089500 [Coregonus suidteri]|uniref:Fibroblast growth factor n=1 Tax=Coregonus suidteri TaxID=861788 RepID=A0AAN8LW59_9TELE
MSVHASWLPVSLLVWGLVCSSVRTAPLAGRQNGALERHWETLYSRSLARNPWEKREITRDGLLEISPVERGVVTIFGVRSGLFLAMNSKGKLYGSGHYNDECKFKESLLANNYNAYESAAHPGMYIGLSVRMSAPVPCSNSDPGLAWIHGAAGPNLQLGERGLAERGMCLAGVFVPLVSFVEPAVSWELERSGLT